MLEGGAATTSTARVPDRPAGGGLLCEGSSNVRIDDTVLQHNSAEIGGAIASVGCTIALHGSALLSNDADYGGAAHLVALGVGELARKRNRRDLRSLRRVLGGTLGLEELRLLELLDDLGVEV